MSFFLSQGGSSWTLYDAFLCVPDSEADYGLTKEELSRWKEAVALCKTKYSNLSKGDAIIERIPQGNNQRKFFNKTLNSFITVGPRYHYREQYMLYAKGPDESDTPQEAEKILGTCYQEAVRLAADKGCSNILLPYIDCERPASEKNTILQAIIPALRSEAARREFDITFQLRCNKQEALPSDISTADLDAYINDKYLDLGECYHQMGRSAPVRRIPFPASINEMMPELEAALSNRNDPFSTALMKYAEKSGMTYAEIYKRANIDRRLFSKMKQPDYRPRKNTILALCIAMKLSHGETVDLLNHAGLALSRYYKFDIIVNYFIHKEFYDIDKINQVLFAYGEPTLGG